MQQSVWQEIFISYVNKYDLQVKLRSSVPRVNTVKKLPLGFIFFVMFFMFETNLLLTSVTLPYKVISNSVASV